MDEGKTIIELDENTNKLHYKKLDKSNLNKTNFVLIFFVTMVIFIFSVSFCILQNFEWKPLINLNKFKRIKNNMNSWLTIIEEKTAIEINKGKNLFLSKPNVGNFTCLDFGNYYVPGRLSPDNYLPQFIKRGNSGPWIINKAANEDESALQFCEYLSNKYISKFSNDEKDLITCGVDMFKKIGYSGYFIPNSPCEKTLPLLNGIDIIF